VIGGMLTATVLAVFLVPVFFVSVRSVFGERPRHEEPALPPQTASPAAES
jgi:multidrug efflux pump